MKRGMHYNLYNPNFPTNQILLPVTMTWPRRSLVQRLDKG